MQASQEPTILDQWSYLDFLTTAPRDGASWVPKYDRRRLAAYIAYATILRNRARTLITADAAKDRREYGDPARVVRRTVSALFGRGGLKVGGDWSSKWAESEMLRSKISIAEWDALGSGDGVLWLTPDPDRKRAAVATLSPGFYFPTLTDDGTFPREVRLAWEFDGDDGKTMVRVIRYWLVRLDRPASYPWGQSPWECFVEDGVWPIGKALASTSPTPWAAFSGEPSWWTEGSDGMPIDGISTGLDFIPVVHLPGSIVSDDQHFGASILGEDLQAYFDIALADSDTAQSSATTGSPMITIESPTTSPHITWGPGSIIQGRADILDTSSALVALHSQTKLLRNLIAESRGLPDLTSALTGQAPSGYAMEVATLPLLEAIGDLRTNREAKYRLLIKFAARIAAAQKWETIPEGETTDIAFGPILPADPAAQLAKIKDLKEAGLISLKTAIEMARDADLIPDTDPIEEEVAAIQREDLDRAGQLLDLTANPEYVANLIGVDLGPGVQP